MESSQVNWKNIQVLVYTKNGKGYVHDNIPNAVAAFQKMGKEHGFTVDVSDDPKVFSDDNLRQYAALIFTSTNNKVFDTERQKVAFMRYIQSGGGLLGVHSAIRYRAQLDLVQTGAGWHFPLACTLPVVQGECDRCGTPSVKDVPKVWTRFDECYFSKNCTRV